MNATTIYSYRPSPIGRIMLLSDGDALTGVFLDNDGRKPSPESHWRLDERHFHRVAEQLDAYFSGIRLTFDLDITLVGTEFQRRVWNELRRIPFGETVTYAEIARRIGKPAAVRAVGAANGRNPLAVIVPCHRVIGADGSLTGYAGGLATKEWLLRHESDLHEDVKNPKSRCRRIPLGI